MADIPLDLLRNLDKTLANMNSFLNQHRRGSGAVGGGRSDDRSASKVESNTKAYNKQVKDAISSMDEFTKQINESNRVYKGAAKKIKDMTEAIFHNEAVTNKQLNDAAGKLIDTLEKSGSRFGLAVRNAEKGMGLTADALVDVGEYLEEYGDAIKEAKVKKLSEIKDYNKLKKTLFSFNSALYSSAEFQQLLKAGDEKSLRAAAKIADEEEKINRKAVESSILTLKRTEAFAEVLKYAKGETASLAKTLGFSATLGGAVATFVASLDKVYTQFRSIASSGFGAAFSDVAINSMKFGMSIQNYTALLKQNQREIGLLGFDGFSKVLSSNTDSLMRMGLTLEESTKATASFTANAADLGVNIRNQSALNDAIQFQTTAFQELRSVTGVTIEEFNQQIKALTTSNSMQLTMSRMSQAQRLNFSKEIILENKRLQLMGLSAEASRKFIESTQTALTGKVSDRFTGGAQLLQAASMLGMGAEGARAQQVMAKGTRATSDERAFLVDFVTRLRGSMDTMSGGSLAMENLVGALDENFSPAITSLMESGREAGLAKVKEMTPGEAETNKKLGQISDHMATFNMKIDQLNNAIHNPLIALVASTATIVVLLSRLVGLSALKNVGGKLLSGAKNGIVGAKNILTAPITGSNIIGGAKAVGSGVMGAGKMIGVGAKLLGWPLTVMGSLWGGFEGAMNAAELFGKDKTGEAVTISERVSGAITGAIDTLSLGFLPPEYKEAIANIINDGITGITDFFGDLWDNVWGYLSATFRQLLRTISGGWAKLIGMVTGSEKISTIGDSLLDKTQMYDEYDAVAEKIKNKRKAREKKNIPAIEKVNSAAIISSDAQIGLTNNPYSQLASSLNGNIRQSNIRNVVTNPDTGETTTVNNITNTTTPQIKAKTTDEILLDIFNKITELVDIENKDLKVKAEAFKLSNLLNKNSESLSVSDFITAA